MIIYSEKKMGGIWLMVMCLCEHLYSRTFIDFDGRIMQFCVDCGYIFPSLYIFT